MIKMYKKNMLKVVDGLIVTDDGTVISIEPCIVHQVNSLEIMMQKRLHMEAVERNHRFDDEVDPDEKFEFESAFHEDYGFELDDDATPTLDKKVDEALSLVDELSRANNVDKANEVVQGFKPLLSWVNKDYVVGNDSHWAMSFDTKHLGNPLEWDERFVMSVIAYCNDLAKLTVDSEGDPAVEQIPYENYDPNCADRCDAYTEDNGKE